MDTTNRNNDRIYDLSNLHDKSVEREVLGLLISRRYAIIESLEVLTPECFYDDNNREIYQAIMKLFNEGETPDLVLVCNELKKSGSSIPPQEIVAICGECHYGPDMTPHVMLLQDMYSRRKIFETATKARQSALDLSIPIEQVHSEAKDGLEEVFGESKQRELTLKEAYGELQNNILLNMDRDTNKPKGTPTGFPEIDSKGGLNKEDLIVVGAETSQGKTSFATALALSAIQNGEDVAFYSMEMSPMQLAARISSMRSSISASKILYSKMSINELNHIDAMMEDVNLNLLHFDDRSTSSLDYITMSIRKLKIKYDISGAVVDYLQLINANDRGLNREQAIAKCARDLKNLAKELKIWIIAISQLSRNQQSPLPTLSRLRDSGEIEQAADLVVLIYRPQNGKNYPEPFADVATKDTAMISIAKGRNIGLSQFICGFNGENTLFYPLSDEQKLRISNPMNATTDPLEEKLPF